MYQMKKFFGCAAVVAALVICLGAGGAWAKDAVVATITNNNGAAVISNGSFTSLGTYAIGTIQLWKEIVATQFPSSVGPFTFCFAAQTGKNKPRTNYPVLVSLSQAGSTNVEIEAMTPSHSLEDVDDGWCTDVYVNIPPAVIADANFQEDNAKLVGNLQIVAPPLSFLDTVTTIQFHLILKQPIAGTCLYLTNFIANNGLSANCSEDGIEVDVTNKVSTDPSNFKNIVLVANNCEDDKTFDLALTKNGTFDFNGAQAVKVASDNVVLLNDDDFFTYLDSNTYPSGGPEGEALCVANQTLAGKSTLFTAIALTIDDSTTNYPDENSDFPFSYSDFSATVKTPNATVCTGSALPDPAQATPNPAEAVLPVNQTCIKVGPTTTCYHE